jgi:hypothetical protein
MPTQPVSRRALVFGACSVALAACAAPAPPEYASFDEAMRAARGGTDAFLAVYRPYEARLDRMAAGAPGVTPAAGPPLSEQIGLGFAAITAFGEVLGRYAEGAEFSEIGAQLDALGRDAGAIAGLVAGPAGYAAVGASTALLGAAVDAVATAANAERFEAAVEATAPDATAFLSGLRTGAAPLMAKVAETVIAESERLAAADGEPRDAGAERAAFAAALEAWVRSVAATEQALAALTAATVGRSRFLTPAEAAEAGARLRAQALEANAAARALDAVLRAGM